MNFWSTAFETLDDSDYVVVNLQLSPDEIAALKIFLDTDLEIDSWHESNKIAPKIIDLLDDNTD